MGEQAMNTPIEQPIASIFAGIRDNLLKPMATEIENSQKECCDAITKHIEEQTKSLSGQISERMTKNVDTSNSAKIESLRSLLILIIILLLCNLSALVLLIVKVFNN